ncbi:MAG: hypothetical protein COA78_28510 [Blastopirellula sp.]|nr:MAG: hypothetical protein COA78_28510 [Blastopirellula sp.]
MSASNQFETALLKLIFQNLPITLIGDAAGLLPSAVAGNLYMGLHIAALDDTDSAQNTDEATYTGYARAAIVRSAAGFTVVGDNVSNAALVGFPAVTAGAESITHFSIGTAAAGIGSILVWGILDVAIAVSVGITPEFQIGQLNVTID